MVEMMMAGVVRKKSRMKRMQLMMKQRIHQEIPPSDRCSLQEGTATRQQETQPRVCFTGGVCGRSLWAESVYLPADVLRVRRVRHTPVVNMQDFAELRGTRLLATTTTLNLTGVEVLQDAVEEGAESG